MDLQWSFLIYGRDEIGNERLWIVIIEILR